MPAISHMMSLLLTSEDQSSILNATIWKLINQKTCLKDRTGELQRFLDTQSKLKEWLQSVLANDQTELAKALKKSSKSTTIMARAEALMESFQSCVEILTPMTKPSIAEMENIVEQRKTMDQLVGQNVNDILGCMSKMEVQEVERDAFQEYISIRSRVDNHSRKFAERASLASSNSQSRSDSPNSIISRSDSPNSATDDEIKNSERQGIAIPAEGTDVFSGSFHHTANLKKKAQTPSTSTVQGTFHDVLRSESVVAQTGKNDSTRDIADDSASFHDFIIDLHTDDKDIDEGSDQFESDFRSSFMEPSCIEKARKSVFAPRRKTASSTGVFYAMAQARSGSTTLNTSSTMAPSTMSATRDGVNDADKLLKLKEAQEKHQKNMSWYFLNNQKVKAYLKERAISFFGMENVMDRYLLNLMATVAWLGLSEMLQQPTSHSACRTEMIQLSGHFVRVILPLFERVLSFQPELLHEDIFHSTKDNAPNAHHNKILRRLLQKITVFETILLSIDVHLFPFTLMCHEGGVKSICLSRTDPNIILTAGYDRLIRIWDLKDGGKMLAQFVGHHSIVPWATFSSNDVLIVSCSFDATVKVWRAYSAKCIRTLNGHTDSILNGDLSPDDKLILSCSMDSTVRLWVVSSGTCHKVFKGHRPGSWVKCVKFSADGKKFVSAGLDKKIVVWDLVESYAPVAVIDEAHSDYILDMCVRKDHLATVSKDRCLKWWTLSDCHSMDQTSRKTSTVSPTAWSSAVAFSLDSRLTACAAFDNCICIYSTIGAKLLRQLHVQNQGVLRIIFSRSSDSIICGTSDGRVQVLPLCSHLYVGENAAAEDGLMFIMSSPKI